MAKTSPVQAVLLPHSHWDREWYEPFESFRPKLVALLDLVLELLDEPGQLAHFHLDGQTIMVEDYLDVRPQMRSVVENHIRGGRLSFGPFYTLTDEFLVSGEGIIRNLEKGLGQAEALGDSLTGRKGAGVRPPGGVVAPPQPRPARSSRRRRSCRGQKPPRRSPPRQHQRPAPSPAGPASTRWG